MREWTNHQIKHLARWYGDKPAIEIAGDLGRPVGAIHKMAQRQGLDGYGGKFNKRRICRAAVKNLAEAGLSVTQIAERLGAHRTSIWYIARRELSEVNQQALARAGAERMARGRGGK